MGKWRKSAILTGKIPAGCVVLGGVAFGSFVAGYEANTVSGEERNQMAADGFERSLSASYLGTNVDNLSKRSCLYFLDDGSHLMRDKVLEAFVKGAYFGAKFVGSQTIESRLYSDLVRLCELDPNRPISKLADSL